MRTGIESVSNFKIQVRIDQVIDNINNLLGELVEIKDRWIGIQTNSMKLVTILNNNSDTLMIFYTMQLKVYIYSSLGSCYFIFYRQFRITSILLFAILFRYWINSLVFTDWVIPDVELTYFYLLFASSMRIFIFPNTAAGITVFDMHYLLSFPNKVLSPFTLFINKLSSTPFHLTSPPQTDREALPDPNLASSETSFQFKTLSKMPLRATARQARPEADEAIPEAVGKELIDYILKFN